MKKIMLLLLGIHCITSMHAQRPTNAKEILTIDDAVQGSDPYYFYYGGNGWTHAANTTDSYYNKTVSYSKTGGDFTQLVFSGNQVEVYSSKASHHGIMAIYLNGGLQANVDLYSATRQNSVLVYSSGLLPEGAYVLNITITGTKNASSSNSYGILDYIKIYKTPSPRTNTAAGFQALFSNRGEANSAFGFESMRKNATGTSNVAVGSMTLFENITGNQNTAVGSTALMNSGTGTNNIAIGASAMYSNSTGSNNTANGTYALYGNVDGWHNTALGYFSGPNSGNLTNTTSIGSNAVTTASDQVRIGSTGVTSIGGQVSWSTLSDGRFKKDIKEDVSGLEFINQLRPVSYSVDKEAVAKFLGVPDSIIQRSTAARKKPERQSGFVAQEVEAVIKKTGYVFHGVEAPQNEKDHYSIRYAEFVVPLVKAVQELNATVIEQRNEIDELKQQLKLYNGSTRDELISTREIELYQNNPNPFSMDTEIKMSLPETTIQAAVIVYNLEGKQLKDMQVRGRGNTSVKIAGSELNAGMYLYALIVDGKVVDTKRMILTK